MRNKKYPGNPFVLAGFVSKELFCNREKELQWLHDQVINHRNVVIYSWRRMGKTALIRCFSRTYERPLQAELVYVDLMGVRNMPEAIKAIAHAVHQKYGRSTHGISKALGALFSRLGMSVSFDPVSGAPKISFGLASPLPPEQSLEALGSFLDSRKKSVILALDEFQQVSSFPEGNAEAAFRSWMQGYPNIRFIFSGSQRNLMRSIFTEQNRPFYKSTQMLALLPIPLDAYREFIQKHFSKASKNINDNVVEEIYRWSRGQTYTIQLICNKAFSSNNSLSPETLQQVFSETIEQEKPVFYNYMKMLTAMQWDVLRAIALSEPVASPHSSDFISRHGLGAPSSVATALNALIEKEMVIQENDTFMLHDVILTRWFQQQA